MKMARRHKKIKFKAPKMSKSKRAAAGRKAWSRKRASGAKFWGKGIRIRHK